MRQRLTAADSVLEILLAPRPRVMTAITVRAEADGCPARDEPAARQLYAAAANRYDVGLSSRHHAAAMLFYRALVPPESLGAIDTARLEAGRIAGGGRTPATRDDYYARRPQCIVLARWDRWVYPRFESLEAWHFADTLFAHANRLRLQASEDGKETMAFCSRDGRRPYVQGYLVLARDSSFAKASWQFVVPESPEVAGGEVYFTPLGASSTPQPLLPMAGLYWRHRLAGVYTEWMEFRDWRLSSR